MIRVEPCNRRNDGVRLGGGVGTGGGVGKTHRQKMETSVERTSGQKVEAQRTKDERIRIRVRGH